MKLIQTNSFLLDRIPKKLQQDIDKFQANKLFNIVKQTYNESRLLNPMSPQIIFLNDVDRTLKYLRKEDKNNDKYSVNYYPPSITKSINTSIGDDSNEERIEQTKQLLKSIVRNKEQYGLDPKAQVYPFFLMDTLKGVGSPFIITNQTSHKNKTSETQFAQTDDITSAMFFIVKYLISGDKQLSQNSPYTHLIVKNTTNAMKRYIRDVSTKRDPKQLFQEIIRDGLKKRLSNQIKHDKLDIEFSRIHSILSPLITSFNLTDPQVYLDDLNKYILNSRHVIKSHITDLRLINKLKSYRSVLKSLINAHQRYNHDGGQLQRIQNLTFIVVLSLTMLINSTQFNNDKLDDNRVTMLRDLNFARLKRLITTHRNSIMTTNFVREFDKVEKYLTTKTNLITSTINNDKFKELKGFDIAQHILYGTIEDEPDNEDYFANGTFANIGKIAFNATFESFYKQLENYILDDNNVINITNNLEKIIRINGQEVSFTPEKLQNKVKEIYPHFIKDLIETVIVSKDKVISNLTHGREFTNFYNVYRTRTMSNGDTPKTFNEVSNLMRNVIVKFNTDSVKLQLADLLDTLISSSKNDFMTWIKSLDNPIDKMPRINARKTPITLSDTFVGSHDIDTIVQSTSVKQDMKINVEDMLIENLKKAMSGLNDINKTNSEFPLLVEAYINRNEQMIRDGFGFDIIFDYALNKMIYILARNLRSDIIAGKTRESSFVSKTSFISDDTFKYTKNFVFNLKTIEIIRNIYVMIDMEINGNEVGNFAFSTFSNPIDYDTLHKMGLVGTNVTIVSDEVCWFVTTNNGKVLTTRRTLDQLREFEIKEIT